MNTAFSFELEISVPSDPEHKRLRLPGVYDDRCCSELWFVIKNCCQLGLDIHVVDTQFFFEGEDEE